MRLIANHAGELIVVHLIRALWKEFCERNWREIEEVEAIHLHSQDSNNQRCRSYAVRFLPNTLKHENNKLLKYILYLY